MDRDGIVGWNNIHEQIDRREGHLRHPRPWYRQIKRNPRGLGSCQGPCFILLLTWVVQSEKVRLTRHTTDLSDLIQFFTSVFLLPQPCTFSTDSPYLLCTGRNEREVEWVEDLTTRSRYLKNDWCHCLLWYFKSKGRPRSTRFFYVVKVWGPSVRKFSTFEFGSDSILGNSHRT